MFTDNCLQSFQNSNVILHETNFGHHFRNENDYSINIDLKMCSWNIEGLKKYYNDISFQSYCSRFDILSFCETWGVSNDEFENFLPGYTNFNFCRRKKNTAARGFGGVTVFVKDWLIKRGSIKRIFDNITECVVLLISAESMIYVNDVILIFTYVSPEYSSIYSIEDNNGIEILNTSTRVVPKCRRLHYFLFNLTS